jgi:hypothetical protein
MMIDIEIEVVYDNFVNEMNNDFVSSFEKQSLKK